MRTPASKQRIIRLEQLVGTILRAGVTASSLCLATGVVLSVVTPGPVATALLHTGVVVLLATPVARVVISIVEYAADHDWMFVTLTAIVLAELMASAVAALVFNRRL
jgi:uncharacterized membrane protein